MTEKKAFQLMADAIYEMHRTLVKMKKDFKLAGNSQNAKKQIMREYADLIKAISQKVEKCTAEWLDTIKEGSLES